MLGLLRMGVAALCLAPFAFYFLRKRRYPIAKFVFSGVTGQVVPALLFGYAMSGVDSGTGGILNSTTALMTLLVGVLLFGMPFRWVPALGIVLGLAGAVALVVLQQGLPGNASPLHAGMILTATFLYGVNGNFVKKHLGTYSALEVSSLGLFFSGLPMLLPLFLCTDFLPRMQTHPEALQSLGAIALLGAAGTALATSLFYQVILKAGALLGSSVTYVITIVALGWAVVAGETIGWGHALGMALILGGVYLTSKK
jgi:drug/metabolite transporter (DMT)-like permease